MSSTGRSSQRQNEPANQRYSNLIYDSEVFLTKLREFKPQSLGCLEARRKSSSTLIFPNPQQACMGPPKCPKYPHNVIPTPGYWIECHGPGLLAAANKSQLASQDSSLTGQFGSASAPDEAAAGGADGLAKAPVDEHQAPHLADRQANLASARPSAGLEFSPVKPDELRLVIDCPSRSSASSASPLPTTPTAERILTRHVKDVLSNQDELDEITRQDVARLWRMRSIEQADTPAHDQQQVVDTALISSPDAPPNSFSNDRSESTNQQTTSSSQANRSHPLRRRFNKRTMTRDDIDLHKPRRGTPNITITEPSFNQSIVNYAPQVKTRTVTRQTSLVKNDPCRFESNDSSSPIQNYDDLIASQSDSHHSNSSVAQMSQESIESPHRTKSCSSDADQYAKLADGDPLDTELVCQVDSSQHKSSGDTLDFKPFRAHHRPSIIREDSDAERVETGPPLHQKEFYCGLSTTTFQKTPHQQAYQQATNTDQFRDGSLELISFEEENYEKHYYGREHWNYFTNDEMLGPVMLSLKQEVNNQRDHFHVLLRTVSYTLHGTIPATTICADRYDREAIVRELSEIAKLKPPLMLGQLPSTPDELLKLDHIFIKTELKVGVIYIKQKQAESEEAILGNKDESPLFSEFLDLLGDRITLKGFDRYKGGLDTVHNLTGTESVYTMWRNIEIMFHVSTMLPHEENDPQKLQKKRHIGNDIVCVAFIESDDTLFWPGCIKSYFIHTFITVRTSPKPLKEGEKRKYSVSCVCRNEVQYAFKPYLVEQDEFYKSDYFREWLLVKIVNGERASYSAPKFARMQDRTRSQLLEDIIQNLANHLVTGQIPKPYRRGSWRPLGHTRASSPLEDSMKDYFEDYEQLAKDFSNAFCGPSRSMLCDVIFKVKDKTANYKLVHGVRAIMAIRSRTFLEMLYGCVPPGGGSSSLQNQTNLRAIEMKALSGDSSLSKEVEQTKSLLAKRGSVGADSGKKLSEKERRQSMLPNLAKSISQKPNYLTVPSTSSGVGVGGGGTSGTSGMIKNAFNRLVSGNWSGWSGNIKGYKGEPMHIKVDQNKTKVDLSSLAICKEIAKIDADKLAQSEFEIKEFDYETFQQTIEYIHNGQCKLSYETIPGLICAAEHYDLPDLLHACFHHANTHMKLSAAPKMMNALYQNSCFYQTAMQLLDAIYDFIDPQAMEFLSKPEYLELYESVFTTLLSRKTLQATELKKFQAMDEWARHQVTLKQQRKQQVQSLNQQEQEKSVELIEYSAQTNRPELDAEYKNLMLRLNKEVNIKLDKITNDDLVKVVLPTKVFSNDKVFNVMSDESRLD